MTNEEIGIVGAGPFGLALSAMLGRAGRPTVLWSQSEELVASLLKTRTSERLPGLELPAEVSATTDSADFAKRCRFLVLAVSSDSARERLAALGKVVDGSHIAVHAIGAFAGPNDQRISQVISEETAILRTGVIAGPSMAADIAAGQVTSLVCASEFSEVTAECRRLLSVPPVMRLYSSHDIVGVELASALSLVYTIAVGLADGLGVGIGIRAVLITRAVSEMSRLGEAAGADSKTFSGLAGLGNLLVRSSTSNTSDERQAPSYRAGLSLAKGATIEGSDEGARATQAGVRLARQFGLTLPVLETTAQVVAGEITAKEAAVQIFKTVATAE